MLLDSADGHGSFCLSCMNTSGWSSGLAEPGSTGTTGLTYSACNHFPVHRKRDNRQCLNNGLLRSPIQ